MSGNAVYFGRSLRPIPLSSYSSASFTSPGIGHMRNPFHAVYVPAQTSFPPVNASINVVDKDNFISGAKSNFLDDKSEEKSLLKVPEKVDPSSEFAPIKIEAKDLYQLKTSQKRAKEGEKEETKSKRSRKSSTKHRFSVV